MAEGPAPGAGDREDEDTGRQAAGGFELVQEGEGGASIGKKKPGGWRAGPGIGSTLIGEV